MTAGVAGRYASALFDLANEQNELDAVDTDLGKFQGLLDQSEDMRRLVKSPTFAAEDQERAMKAVMDWAAIGATTGNFLEWSAVVAEDDDADVVGLEVQRHAGDAAGELDHPAGLHVVEPVDTRDAVAHRQHLADLGDLSLLAEVLDLLLEDRGDLCGPDFHHLPLLLQRPRWRGGAIRRRLRENGRRRTYGRMGFSAGAL